MSSSIKHLSQDYLKNTQENVNIINNYSYFIKDQIGCGCSSRVFKGSNNVTNQLVAIKIIQLKFLKSALQKSLLTTEKKVISLLIQQQLAGITKYYEIIETPTRIYMIMQYEEGGNLQQVVKKKTMSQSQVKNLLLQIINAYLNLNQHKIIHRDLKPANILDDGKGGYKIADFGFSVIQQQQIKKYNYCLGSPVYSSPQSLQSFTYGVKSDIWALGVIIYKCLMGKTPWRAKNNKELIEKMKSTSIQTLIEGLNDISLLNFIKGCCTVSLTQRIGIKQLISYKTILQNQIISKERKNYIEALMANKCEQKYQKITKRKKSWSKQKITKSASSQLFTQPKNNKHKSFCKENYLLNNIKNDTEFKK